LKQLETILRTTIHNGIYVFLAYNLFIRVLCAVLVVVFVGILSPTFHNATLFQKLLHGDYNTNNLNAIKIAKGQPSLQTLTMIYLVNYQIKLLIKIQLTNVIQTLYRR